MTWISEDGGVNRQQWISGARLNIIGTETLKVTSRSMMVLTMVVLASPDDVFVLCHTGGNDAVSWVERVHPETLETIASSERLAGGPAWPGGLAVHPNGDLYVVFGNHAHRLGRDLGLVASRELPRLRPYNSFVLLPSGHLVVKDFSGPRPGNEVVEPFDATQLVVLEPIDLEIVATLDMPEASIARLSADGNDIYVVGTTSLWRVKWNNFELTRDDFCAEYRQFTGQSFGWDAVIADGCAWFLDNGESSHKFAGTLRGVGTSTTPLHLVRVKLDDGRVSMTEICGLPNGVVANPPLIDASRKMAIGFDSGNGVLTGFSYDENTITKVWSYAQNHGSHMLLFQDSGEFVSADHDETRSVEQVVIRDVVTGREKARVDTTSPIQSVVFHHRRIFYILLATGLRIGELLSMRVGDLDLQKRCMVVKMSKTKSGNRNIYLGDHDVAVLSELLVTLGQEGKDAEALLVRSVTGKPLRYRNLVERVLRPVIKTQGMKPFMLHDLRRTHATMLVASGNDPKTVQERMGHVDIETTLNFYAKTTEEGRRRATGAIVQFLAQEKTPEALVNGVVGAATQ